MTMPAVPNHSNRFPGLWESLARSCVDFNFYALLANRPWYQSVGYLLFLVTCAALVSAFISVLWLGTALRTQWPDLAAQIPDIMFFKGEALVTAPQPVYIKNNDVTWLIIDTTGRINSLAGREAQWLLNRTQLQMKNDDGSIMSFPLQTSQWSQLAAGVAGETASGPERPLYINQAALADLAAWMLPLAPSYAFALGFGLLLGFALFNILIMSIVGILATPGRIRRPGYGIILTISVYAYTPATLWWIFAQLARPENEVTAIMSNLVSKSPSSPVVAMVLYLIMAFYIYRGTISLSQALYAHPESELLVMADSPPPPEDDRKPHE